MDFKLEGGRSHSGVDRLFARKKIEKLTSSLAEGVSKESVRKKIVELGIEHHLVTKHTSLVAVEQVASRPKDQQLKTSPAPVNLPHGWRYGSVFGTAEERTLAMPEVEELGVTEEMLAVDPDFFGPLMDQPLHLALRIERP